MNIYIYIVIEIYACVCIYIYIQLLRLVVITSVTQVILHITRMTYLICRVSVETLGSSQGLGFRV